MQAEVREQYAMNVSKHQIWRAKRLLRVVIEGCKKVFLEVCRPLIGVDGCHLNGPYTGQILTAVGVDGNNGMFPIAYTVVEAENKMRQKGLLPTIETAMPIAQHRMCVRHLYSNFRGQHSGLLLKNLLWAAARATTVPWYKAEMEKMKVQDNEAYKWL
ncbi:unnamed protein product [Prunus armeniaca]